MHSGRLSVPGFLAGGACAGAEAGAAAAVVRRGGQHCEVVDIKSDYKEEVTKAMQIAIARAWVDPTYKAALIADPAAKLAEFGVYFPDQYKLEFYDDPTARIGDWTSTGKNQTAVLRVPIPAAPPGGNVSSMNGRLLEASWHATPPFVAGNGTLDGCNLACPQGRG
jgi:hypothetical protein